MSSASSVEQVLGEIAAQSPEILGCVVVTEQRIYNNLTHTLKGVDVDSVVNYTSNMFEISRALDRTVTPFNQLFLEFGGVSIYALLVNDTILMIVTHPMQRADCREVQDAAHQYLEPLQEALFAAEGDDRPHLVATVQTLHGDAATGA